MKTTKTQEIRTFDIRKFNKRDGTDDGQDLTVSGHASVFSSPTDIGGAFLEQIAPGAFSKTLAENSDIRCLYNHNWDNILGRTKSGTLELEEDEQGLAFTVTLPNTSVARDLAVSMTRGDVDKCSFGFVPTAEEWDFTNADYPTRTITAVDLYEVSIVTIPAYDDTDAQLNRSKLGQEKMISLVEKRKKMINQIKGALTNE
ncbi:HK97 family phage prohead protease [Levilactobacillus namurensis]|uniref:HK97 family phage prohead protease n=1 Tax=Levilactobacillus namurensis TaxID=380393 RepID=UPI00046462F7|nr:HK97 family phage prohead protease [Levilactobacillus namurensis]MCW3778506.1 HK97 family phage prohead protease [Levilactobacillus namurensis]MDT7019573.1 HK97 family phage prohead protease [Levilactobacillus namurensis]WNN65839.1 HK97 family phage prohead protease [Levilactobacillus namurensis]